MNKILLTGLALVLAITSGCTRRNSSNGEDAPIPTELPGAQGDYVMSLSITDADGALLDDETSLEFSGISLIDVDGKTVETTKVSDGLVSLYSDEKGDIIVRASADGYFTETAKFSITKGISNFTISLTKETTNALIEQAEVVTFSKGSSDLVDVEGPEKVSVTVFTGDEITGVDGSSLTGAVSVSVAEFDLDESAEKMPGAFEVVSGISGSSSKEDIEKAVEASDPVEMLGVMKISAEAAGKEAATSDKGVAITFSLPADFLAKSAAPLAKLKEGDKVWLVKFDVALGVWVKVKEVEVTKQGGEYVIQVSITEFGWYALAVILGQDCTDPFNVLVPNFKGKTLNYSFAKFGWAKYGYTNGSDTISIKAYPEDAEVDMNLVYSGVTIKSSKETLTCGGTLVIDEKAPSSMNEITVLATAFCDGETETVPVEGMIVGIAQDNKQLFAGVTGADGAVSFDLVNGAQYAATIKLPGGNAVQETFRVTGDQTVELDFAVSCPEITGASGN